jgi:hypothetical protein
MSPNMKKKLERNIEYHQDVADYYQGIVTAKEGEPAVPDHDQILVDLHSEVVNQLNAVVVTHATPPAVLNAPSVFRNASPELKPTSGRFH